MPVAFKQNLPLFAGFGLVAAGLVALAVFLRRPEEDLLREAAAKHGATLGTVGNVLVYGPVADIEVAGRPVLHAEFARQGGTWTFSKDLGADFERVMKDPATSGELQKRLAQRVADHASMSVILREGLRYEYRLGRRADGLEGEVVVNFSYPPQNGRPIPGRYRELFRYAEGTWQSQGQFLYNKPPAPPPR